MEHLIKGLIDKLSSRKSNEMAHFAKYKNEELRDLMLISSGKIYEIDYMMRELKTIMKYKTKRKNF